ncbi:MAG: sigma-70 family RNA polymerase sigma factor [Polyangiaceae bacterium]|nr:sigma-70 family RNA polymerase sigma factor [Polyangiaceae bacterium]
MRRAPLRSIATSENHNERSRIELRVREALPVVEAISNKMFQRLGGAVSREELASHGRAVLVDVIESYEEGRAPFLSYVAVRVRWAMLEEARKHARKRKAWQRVTACLALDRLAANEEELEPVEPTTEAQDQRALSDFLARRAAAVALGLVSSNRSSSGANDAESPEEELEKEQLYRDVRRAVTALPEQQRVLIERCYFGGANLDLVARDLGISKSWASRVHAKAMSTLADVLRERV